MADEKKDDCGCGGCGCGRSKSNGECAENDPGGNAGSSACSIGEAIAVGAIVNMENAEIEEERRSAPEITEADIDGFIEKCYREGKNPLDVVKFLAEMNSIDIFSKCVPKDVSRRVVYNLLKGVVKKVLIGFVSYCVDSYGLGFLQSLIDSFVSCRDSEKSSRSSGNGSEDSVVVRPVSVRLIPVRVGYAFTW